MVGEYLYGLIDNCHALSRKTADSKAVKDIIRAEVSGVMSRFAISNQGDLIRELTNSTGKKRNEIITSSKYCRIFFLVNSFGEYNREQQCFDELGRFKYEYSFQKQTGLVNNEVLRLIIEIAKNDFNEIYTIRPHQSYFFLSHDIDSVYGSLVQDGAWAVKQGRVDVLLKLFTNILIAKPHWLNIDQIMNLESEYDFKSTFYWLVNKGRIDQRQTNSDYHINAPVIKETLQRTEKRGFENGLHKSISEETMSSEMSKMPTNVIGNRYHYLKFRVPEGYHSVEKAGLKLDASLGFAEHFGFRNNYGYPFHPYNTESNTRFSFLEVPLTIMDGTFHRYMKVPVNQTAGKIIEFLDQHSKNTLHSILWHNTFFTNYKYKGYLDEYKKILHYLKENNFRNLNQSQIIETFTWKTR